MSEGQVSPAADDRGGMYQRWDDFLKVAIREYYDRGFTTRKGNFIALLIASGQTALKLAKDSVVDGSGTKRVAIGAAALVALRFALKYFIGGPIGLVLTVAASASMVSYFVRNQKDILKKVTTYRRSIGETRERYDELQSGWRDGRYDQTERNLMIDGLMKRFIQEIDES